MTDNSTLPDASQLIGQLQTRLLALGREVDDLPTAEIEKTAKAINQLIVGLEKADGYLREHGRVARPGDRLRGVPRQVFLRKIKTLVDRGILDELDD